MLSLGAKDCMLKSIEGLKTKDRLPNPKCTLQKDDYGEVRKITSFGDFTTLQSLLADTSTCAFNIDVRVAIYSCQSVDMGSIHVHTTSHADAARRGCVNCLVTRMPPR